jgi:hypothetical protein
VFFNAVGRWKEFLDKLGSPLKIPGMKKQYLYHVKLTDTGDVGFHYSSGLLSGGLTGQGGTASPCILWRKENIPQLVPLVSESLVNSQFPPASDYSGSIPPVLNSMPKDFPVDSEQRRWWDRFLATGETGVVLRNDNFTDEILLGETADLSGVEIRVIYRFPPQLFDAPESWRVPSVNPDFKSLDLDEKQFGVITVPARRLRHQGSVSAGNVRRERASAVSAAPSTAGSVSHKRARSPSAAAAQEAEAPEVKRSVLTIEICLSH